MILYTLKCDNSHGFDSWFQSSDAFEKLRVSGHVTCPDCGSGKVDKALMTPQVCADRTKATAAATVAPRGRPLSGPPTSDSERALAALRRQVEQGSDYVGMNFATEARAMHDGSAPERSIWGEARADEARRLIDDGIPVAPLPFRAKSKSN